MKLRNILIFNFIALLFISSSVIFFTPIIIVKKDVARFIDQLDQSILSQHPSFSANLKVASQKVAWKISYQLFFILFVLFIMIGFYVSRRLLSLLISPLQALSEATKEVVAGNYADVNLPSMDTRKDEMATLVFSFKEMLLGLQEKEKIRAVLDKVVSKDIAKAILHSNIQLGGEDRQISVLFADIRHFTQITRHMTPQQIIELLNRCMTKVTQVIDGEGGVVDKYIGDAVMAIYGAPTITAHHAINAVSTALMIIKAITKWNEQRKAQDLIPMHLGIGIHSGLAVVGNMGAEDRLNYTALGQNVILASRLCQIAGEGQVLITEQTLIEPGVKEAFVTRRIEDKKLKGFSHPVAVYEVLDFNWERER